MAEKIPFDRREIVLTLMQHGYELKDLVGSGGFASVYTCRHMRYNEIFCVKIITLNEDSKKNLAGAFESEFQTLVKIIHPNIISIFDNFQSENCLYLILEYCPNGSLNDLIKKNECIYGQQFIDYCRQILHAISYCHSIGIAHRDIKPQNILIDIHHRPKLADFGLAQFYNSNEKEKGKFGGSLPYMAPELILKHEFNPVAVDVWALGITFYQMAIGRLPWATNQYFQEITNGFILIPNEMDPLISQMLRKMLDVEPKRRMSLDKVLELPIFQTDQADMIQPSMSLRQMSGLAPGVPSTSSFRGLANSSSILKSSASKSRKKIRSQGSTVFSKKRVALSFTFSEADEPPYDPNNPAPSMLV